MIDTIINIIAACAIITVIVKLLARFLVSIASDDDDDPGGTDFDVAITRWTDMLNRRNR